MKVAMKDLSRRQHPGRVQALNMIISCIHDYFLYTNLSVCLHSVCDSDTSVRLLVTGCLWATKMGGSFLALVLGTKVKMSSDCSM